MTVSTKREPIGKVGKVYHLTLEEIRQYYYPKHISVAELKSQVVGTTITMDCDTISIIPQMIKNYPKPENQ